MLTYCRLFRIDGNKLSARQFSSWRILSMEDKSLHRRIAKYLFTVGTGEVTRGDGHFRFPVPAATLDTDRYRARTSLRGSFISPDCSLRPVDDTATIAGCRRTSTIWSEPGTVVIVSVACLRAARLPFFARTLTTRETLLFENDGRCTR